MRALFAKARIFETLATFFGKATRSGNEAANHLSPEFFWRVSRSNANSSDARRRFNAANSDGGLLFILRFNKRTRILRLVFRNLHLHTADCHRISLGPEGGGIVNDFGHESGCLQARADQIRISEVEASENCHGAHLTSL